MRKFREEILFEDFLDDMEASQKNASEEIISDEEKFDIDDATHWTHTFYVEKPDIVTNGRADNIEKIIDELDSRIGHLCMCIPQITSFSGFEFYYNENTKNNYPQSPKIHTAPFYDSFRFSIVSSFKNIKQAFKFINSLFCIFDKTPIAIYVAIYIECIASENGKWAVQEDEDIPVETHQNINIRYIHDFLNLDCTEPMTSSDSLAFHGAFKIATFFFRDKIKIISDFKKYYPEKLFDISFYETSPRIKRLFNEDDKLIFTENDISTFSETIMSSEITFSNFMKTVRNTPMPDAQYFISDLTTNNVVSSFNVVSQKGLEINKALMASEQDNIKFQLFYERNRGRLNFRSLIDFIVGANDIKTVTLNIRAILVKSSTPDNEYNKKAISELLELVSSLYADCLTKDLIRQITREIIYFIPDDHLG